MAIPTIPIFRHRHSDGGMWDSICLSCFGTVVTLTDEGQLAPHEDTHRCDPFRLHQLAEDGRPWKAAQGIES